MIRQDYFSVFTNYPYDYEIILKLIWSHTGGGGAWAFDRGLFRGFFSAGLGDFICGSFPSFNGATVLLSGSRLEDAGNVDIFKGGTFTSARRGGDVASAIFLCNFKGGTTFLWSSNEDVFDGAFEFVDSDCNFLSSTFLSNFLSLRVLSSSARCFPSCFFSIGVSDFVLLETLGLSRCRLELILPSTF